MHDDDPIMGRFFARSCQHNELSNGDVFVNLDGFGYAWSNATLRVTFDASASIRFNQDLLMHASTMYAYFRTRAIVSQNTRVRVVEQGAKMGVGTVAIAESVAPTIFRDQLERGFTVIRDPDGSVDFSMGIVEKGQRRAKPFKILDSNRVTLVNERVEVRGNQLDFMGPFSVESNDDALRLTILVEGTSAIDVMVVDQYTGNQWLESYVKAAGVPQPPMPPISGDVVEAGALWEKAVPVRKGKYFVVIDNSSAVGMVSPPKTGAVPPAALVSVAVQIGQ